MNFYGQTGFLPLQNFLKELNDVKIKYLFAKIESLKLTSPRILIDVNEDIFLKITTLLATSN